MKGIISVKAKTRLDLRHIQQVAWKNLAFAVPEANTPVFGVPLGEIGGHIVFG